MFTSDELWFSMKDMTGYQLDLIHKALSERKFEEAGRLMYEHAMDYEDFEVDQ
jgi:hypothetical protein